MTTFWLTGRSGSGKSTLAEGIARVIHDLGLSVHVLDSDSFRRDMQIPPDFSKEGRIAHTGRIGRAARMLSSHGIVAVVACISPYREARDAVRSWHVSPDAFFEVYVSTPAAECAKRDPKGLYSAGVVKETDEYEEPTAPEVVIDTTSMTISHAVHEVFDQIHRLPKVNN